MPLAATVVLLIVSVPALRLITVSDRRGLDSKAPEPPGEAAWQERQWSLTPADQLSESHLTFRLGVRAFDLERALLYGDLARAEQFVGEMQQWLRVIPLSQPLVAQYTALRDRIREGRARAELGEEAARLSRSMEEYLGSYTSFGKWCAAAQFAARAQERFFFESAYSARELRRIGEQGFPAADREEVGRIVAIVRGGMRETAFAELQVAIEALIERNAG